jgi:hypothetical protein
MKPMKPSTSANVYCIGILGRLFGHKFVKSGWTSTGNCFRCGKPEGAGWERRE